MIELRFVYHPSIFSWLCRWLAQYGFEYTHVEFLRRARDYDESFIGPRDVDRYIGAMGDGVKARPVGYDTGKFTNELFVNMACTDEQAIIFEAFIESQIGKPYDYWAVLAFFCPWRDWQEFDHWDCIELIGTGWGEIGMLPRKKAIKFSRLTVLGGYEMAIMRTEAEDVR